MMNSNLIFFTGIKKNQPTPKPPIKAWAVMHSGYPSVIYSSRDEAEFVSDLDNALCGKVASVSAVTITIDEVA